MENIKSDKNIATEVAENNQESMDVIIKKYPDTFRELYTESFKPHFTLEIIQNPVWDRERLSTQVKSIEIEEEIEEEIEGPTDSDFEYWNQDWE